MVVGVGQMLDYIIQGERAWIIGCQLLVPKIIYETK
jgi:hypothetical protein